MKKLLFTAAFAAFGLVGVNAQTGVEGGVHIGLPIGKTADVSSFNIGVNVGYLAPVADNFYVGGRVGYDHFIGKDIGYVVDGVGYNLKKKDFGFIPIAATAKYDFADSNIFVGGDLGYAVSASKDLKGGIFYQPKIGYSAPTWDVFVGYKGIGAKTKSNIVYDRNFNAITLGFAYKF